MLSGRATISILVWYAKNSADVWTGTLINLVKVKSTIPVIVETFIKNWTGTSKYPWVSAVAVTIKFGNVPLKWPAAIAGR